MGAGGWIAVDLDGTLAHYEGWQGEDHIGAPIPVMVERVKRWLAEGYEVRIFTARMFRESSRESRERLIKAWTLEHIGVELQPTCIKDFDMIELWDDRAVQVVPNTGELLGRSTRGLE